MRSFVSFLSRRAICGVGFGGLLPGNTSGVSQCLGQENALRIAESVEALERDSGRIGHFSSSPPSDFLAVH